MADIVVTAQAARGAPMAAPVTVQQEGLGDLKLYRVPLPVTVAANAQKQVALAEKPGVKVEALYRAEVWEDNAGEVRQMLRTRNRKEDGLGLPLPGGPVTVLEPRGDTMLLAGEGGLSDPAEGEDVEIMLSPTTQVTLEAQTLREEGKSRTLQLTARNARPVPIRFEARIATSLSSGIRSPSDQLKRKEGRSIWAITIPPGATKTLTYKLVNSN
ncbi:MAG: hypothetical protein V4521_14050, partial [Pseudomonadota bacterium]